MTHLNDLLSRVFQRLKWAGAAPRQGSPICYDSIGMGVSIHTISGPLDEERRGDLIYGGGLLVFKDVAPLREVASLAEGLIGEAVSIDELQARFKRDERVNKLFRAALEHVGVTGERTYWDSIRLRVVPPIESHAGPQIGRIGVHRDTWGSNVLQQTNWWTTLRPLSALRTIAFYPRYWERPIANNSADWDLDAVRERRRRGERVEELPIVPEPTEPVDTESELRMVVEPGDFLCFSGAHLHASVPNTSDATRYSVELRTVYADDLTADRGAPNLDGRAPAVPLEWFRSMADGTPLREPKAGSADPARPERSRQIRFVTVGTSTLSRPSSSSRVHCGVPLRSTRPRPSRYATKAGWPGSRPAATTKSVPLDRRAERSNSVKSPIKPVSPSNRPRSSWKTLSGASPVCSSAVRSPKTLAGAGRAAGPIASRPRWTPRRNASAPKDASRPPPST